MQILNNDEIPIGLSMAFAENLHAMNRFSQMTEDEQRDVLRRSRQANSKQEMRALVSELDRLS